MIYLQDLENTIFNRHVNNSADELVILSGYVGPNPIQRLQQLQFRTTVIYGMYGTERITGILHNTLTSLNSGQTNIYYSNLPVHSKCYAWYSSGSMIDALVGSANFSVNGLTIPHREMLADLSLSDLPALDRYISMVRNLSIPCTDPTVRLSTVYQPAAPPAPAGGVQSPSHICDMSLLSTRTHDVHARAGLNWGFAAAHVLPDDAYIAITAEHIRRYPQLFPPKQQIPLNPNHAGRVQRENDAIDIIWDDGTLMEGLMEGQQQDVDGVVYPKQITSSAPKSTLGLYFRRRLGVQPGQRVTLADLNRYGRTTVSVSMLSQGIYFFDFSVANNMNGNRRIVGRI